MIPNNNNHQPPHLGDDDAGGEEQQRRLPLEVVNVVRGASCVTFHTASCCFTTKKNETKTNTVTRSYETPNILVITAEYVVCMDMNE